MSEPDSGRRGVRQARARRIIQQLREAFVLKQAEERAKAYTPEQSARLWFLHETALERLRAARDLRDATRIGAAGAVYRETLLLLPRTLLFAWDPERAVEELDVAELWRELEARLLVPEPHGVFRDAEGRRLEAFRQARALALEPDPLALDRLAPADAVQRLDAVHETLQRLLDQIEPRSVAALRRSRVRRFTAVALLPLLVAGLLLMWAAVPENVALDKPVQASSYWPGSPSADALVNGVIESPWASATAGGADAWFSVDLLEEHELERLVVYNRSDEFAQETAPFCIEISSDGSTYREVGRFDGAESSAERWVFEAEGLSARYVRVKKLDARGLGLSELEVYGSKR